MSRPLHHILVVDDEASIRAFLEDDGFTVTDVGSGERGLEIMAQCSLHPSDPLARHLNEVGKAAESAASLTRQLLAFSRRQIIEPEVLNLNDLVGNLQKMLGRLIGEDITLQTTLDKDLGPVKVDPGQAQQRD